jgi:hypothetical protein
MSSATERADKHARLINKKAPRTSAGPVCEDEAILI